MRGVVQGVGFRPFVYNAARARGLGGWVRNEADTVRIEVEGTPAAVDSFVEAIRKDHPPQARIEFLELEELPSKNGRIEGFHILASPEQGTPRPTIPADLATCEACLEEIRTPGERRFRYPFTNCTACGPRWSIIRALPYDRPRTSMAGFILCSECKAEYHDPADRRFHAQPIACPKCGPQLRLLDGCGQVAATGSQALDQAVASILAGQIVALQGLGGFQLLVDATNRQAVARLRDRKRRPDKPFAVMLPSLEEARRWCEVSEAEAAALASPQAPILLLCRRNGDVPGGVAPGVAPGNPYLGVMLPYTPLHHLLLAALGRRGEISSAAATDGGTRTAPATIVVCTSGNLSEEPMAITAEDALARLGAIADRFLVHDRPIVRPVDDSVARVGPEGLQVLRRARGYAPLPIDLGRDGPVVLATGGHLKNTVALSLGRQAVLSPHVGDLDCLLSVEVHQRAIEDLVEFFQVVPEVVACDLHPDYASTRQAAALAVRWHAPLIQVQHHHAHVAACMAEHRLEEPILGFSWDGTGYGPDGTVWGGEALECQGAEFRRVAHLRTFPLAGGDRAVREPRRSALGVLHEVLGARAAEHAAGWFKIAELGPLLRILDNPRLSPRTSSMGRLFDAVAALCGLPLATSFEGQSAMALEFAADPDCREAYPMPLSGLDPAVADWGPMLLAVLADRAAGVSIGRISARFHNAMAEMAVAVARRIYRPGDAVVLSGGCFQNLLLTERVRSRLLEAGFRVYLHRQVPPGDGGIALGQAWIAARMGKTREGCVLKPNPTGATRLPKGDSRSMLQ